MKVVNLETGTYSTNIANQKSSKISEYISQKNKNQEILVNTAKNELVDKVDIRSKVYKLTTSNGKNIELVCSQNAIHAYIIEDNTKIKINDYDLPTILKQVKDQSVLEGIINNSYFRTSILSNSEVKLYANYRLKGGMFQEKIKNTSNSEMNKIIEDTQKYLLMVDDIKKQFSEEALLVLGNTGSGKSTLVNFLSGRELSVKTGGCKPTIVVKDPIVSVSDKYTSETFKPNRWHDEVNKIVYWDCPGFEDNRGPAEDIANGFFIKEVFKNISKVKFMLVIPEGALIGEQRGAKFTSLIKSVAELLPNFSKFDQSFCTVITHGNSDTSLNAIKSEIGILAEQSKSLTPEVQYILKHLISNESKMEKFNAPVKEEDKLTKLIKEKDSLEDKIDNSKDELTTKQLTEEFNLLKSQIKDLKNSNIQYSEQYSIDPIAKDKILKILHNSPYTTKEDNDLKPTISIDSKNVVFTLSKMSKNIIVNIMEKFADGVMSHTKHLLEDNKLTDLNKVTILAEFYSNFNSIQDTKKQIDEEDKPDDFIKYINNIATKIKFDTIGTQELKKQVGYISFYKQVCPDSFNENISLHTHDQILPIINYLKEKSDSVTKKMQYIINESIDGELETFYYNIEKFCKQANASDQTNKLQRYVDEAMQNIINNKSLINVKIIEELQSKLIEFNINTEPLNSIKKEVKSTDEIKNIAPDIKINDHSIRLKFSQINSLIAQKSHELYIVEVNATNKKNMDELGTKLKENEGNLEAQKKIMETMKSETDNYRNQINDIKDIHKAEMDRLAVQTKAVEQGAKQAKIITKLDLVCVRENSALVATGGIIKLSEVINNSSFSSNMDVKIFALDKVLIDRNIFNLGKNFTIIAPEWIVQQSTTINLSGATGSSGRDAGGFGIGSGGNGSSGGNGGSFYGIGKDFQGMSNLTIYVSGGSGGRAGIGNLLGSNGSRGADGTSGARTIEGDYTISNEGSNKIDSSELKKEYTKYVQKINQQKGVNIQTFFDN